MVLFLAMIKHLEICVTFGKSVGRTEKCSKSSTAAHRASTLACNGAHNAHSCVRQLDTKE